MALVVSGAAGQSAAFSVQRNVPGSDYFQDGRTDPSVDLILTGDFKELTKPDLVDQTPGKLSCPREDRRIVDDSIWPVMPTATPGRRRLSRRRQQPAGSAHADPDGPAGVVEPGAGAELDEPHRPARPRLRVGVLARTVAPGGAGGERAVDELRELGDVRLRQVALGHAVAQDALQEHAELPDMVGEFCERRRREHRAMAGPGGRCRRLRSSTWART